MTLCVEELTYSAELELGDGFIVLASCYHCGSANTTEDQEKLAYSCFMAKGYLRQVRGCVASRLSIY